MFQFSQLSGDHVIGMRLISGRSFWPVTTIQTNGTCPVVLTRTWLLTDLCGNTGTVSQTVTNLDTAPPLPMCYGLNLVPNPRFENFMPCPSGLSQPYVAYPWNTASDATPDYFNLCATGDVGVVPTNLFGVQMPYSGQGYMGAFIVGTAVGYTVAYGSGYYHPPYVYYPPAGYPV